MKHTLPSVLAHLKERRSALGHFNVSDLVLLKAVLVAAAEVVKQVVCCRLQLIHPQRPPVELPAET